MPRLETTLTQKGQATIPVEIRNRLGLKPGDRVRFEIDGDEVKLRPAESRIARWYGAVEPRRRPEDFRTLREEFEQGVADEVAEETRQ